MLGAVQTEKRGPFALDSERKNYLHFTGEKLWHREVEYPPKDTQEVCSRARD